MVRFQNRGTSMPSFDIVSRTDMPEVDNAVNGAMREIGTRYDFKGSACSIERKDDTLQILADDDMKLRQVQERSRSSRASNGSSRRSWSRR
jgi:hypothetical protein